MEKWKKAALKILYPGKILVWLIPILGFALLGLVFFKGWEDHPLAYLSYVLAFYSLVLMVLAGIPAVRKAGKDLRRLQAKRPYYLRKSLLRGLAINISYGLFQFTSGLVYRSVWFFSCGIYYVVLSLIRLVLVRYEKKQSACECETEKRIVGWSGFQVCGILMLALNLAMSGMVFQMIWRGEGSHYPEIMVYAVAAYTFYRLTISILRVFQKRGKQDPLEGAARNINLTAAMMSLYSLQAAMLNAFGDDPAFALLMNSLSGAAVCFLVILGAVGMTIHGAVRKAQAS